MNPEPYDKKMDDRATQEATGGDAMAISEKSKKITEILYVLYGSSTGYLFGVPPEKRQAVEAIVSCVLDINDTTTFEEA